MGDQLTGGNQVIDGWVANGVQFYKLADGRLAAVKKNGRIKIWRPKKPIVIFSGGAGNLRTFLRADAALDRQSKKLKKVMTRRSPSPRKPKQTMIYQHPNTGPEIVNVK